MFRGAGVFAGIAILMFFWFAFIAPIWDACKPYIDKYLIVWAALLPIGRLMFIRKLGLPLWYMLPGLFKYAMCEYAGLRSSGKGDLKTAIRNVIFVGRREFCIGVTAALNKGRFFSWLFHLGEPFAEIAYSLDPKSKPNPPVRVP